MAQLGDSPAIAAASSCTRTGPPRRPDHRIPGFGANSWRGVPVTDRPRGARPAAASEELPCVGGHGPQLPLRPPAELRAVSARRRRPARPGPRPAFGQVDRETVAGDLGAHVDHLTDRVAGPVAQVVHAVLPRPGCWSAAGGVGQVGDVDVVADTGPVRGGIVVAQDSHRAARCHAASTLGIRWVSGLCRSPSQPASPRSRRDVEVAQAGRADPDPGELGQRGVHGDLRRAVGAGRRVGRSRRSACAPARRRPRRWRRTRSCARRRASPPAARACRPGWPTSTWPACHRLADQRLRREVQHRLHAVGQHLGGRLTQRALDDVAPAAPRRVAGGQVIEHGDLVAGRQERCGDDAPDIPGAAGDEHATHRPPLLAGIHTLAGLHWPTHLLPGRKISR